MKALLVAVNAKYIHSNLGIYSIRAYGLAHGIPASSLEIAEYTINQHMEDILADIYRRKPELIGFSCYIWNIQVIRELAAELHKVLPEVPIWFGGPEVSYHAVNFVKEYPWLTGIMVGEGEETFLELYQAYKRGTELADVAGLVYRGADIIQTVPRPKLPMDALVFPYQDMDGLEHRIVYYETSRGCPFGCSYCLSSTDRQVRLRSMELVERELQFFLDRRVPQVKFVDRTFNCQREHTMAIWKYIHEHDNGVTNFHFELSADLLTDEEIAYVSQFRPGLVQFEIGVQSTNKDTMKAINRVCDLQHLRDRVERIHASRTIHQHLDLIAGLPYEDYTSFRNSFNDVHSMKPDQLQLGFLKMLQGSPMEGKREEYGIVCQDRPPYEVLYTPWLSYDDVLRLKQVEAMTEQYYNSQQFEASRHYLESLFPTPFDFYQSLGEYYDGLADLGAHHSRIQNYEILLQFLDECTKGDGEILSQLLTYDLYARENLKSRPDFANNSQDSEWREMERKWYQDEGQIERYLPDYQDYGWKQTLRMTHLEQFDLDVLRYLNEGTLVEKKCVLLFDYQKRDPLSYQARVVDVSVYWYRED
ncbi:MAG: B12-binding domain-containing radical SAM protein [Lachnospiraceae bacterium]|nr:B12-binding domain-containing radical SAM protein [Lachnospiraceae bacterium]